MRTEFVCIPCVLKSFVKRLEHSNLPRRESETAVRDFLIELSESDYELSPPELGRKLHYKIKEILYDPDPYKNEKYYFNNLFMSKYDEFATQINNSRDSFKSALKLTLLGNIIDFATQDEIDIKKIFSKLSDLIINVDRSEELKNEINNVDKILYLGDNSGEIVFDKLFIETFLRLFGIKNITFVVRSGPIINDATIEDANFVGIYEVADVIDSGYDAPGIILSCCSEEFLHHYNTADVVISKGQGNFESLSKENKNIFFLLMAKCSLVADLFGAKKGDLIVGKREDIQTNDTSI